MTTPAVEHGPKGGCEPEDVRLLRRVPSLMGEKNDKGEDFVDFPAWFTRTNRRLATIQTGFGVVTLRAIQFQEGELETNASFLTALTAFLSLPDWKVEYPMTLKGEKSSIELKEGDPIPTPAQIVAKQDPLLARNYWDECLPPGTLQQVMAAQMFLRIPPLVYASRDPQ